MIYIVDFNTCYKIGQTSDLRKRIRAFRNAREKADCIDLIISSENPVDQKSVEKLSNWSSMTPAGKELGIPVSSISLCCKGVYKTAGGYLWRVEEKVL